ncbi:ribosome biogenesis protein WDR12 homolog [Agrilus planipennis]|uniref:Ribosome biogenesis protein WDR12 homolog n=1 Tax=Agrilus planipennis TaxID=224129 RepID=A0A1W4WZ08_AGRPL|nr:ribosome biogenesis protein WDR12 homolog [Agrilus planipennis]
MENIDPSSESQLHIRLITKQEQYAVPDIPYSVPATIDTIGLNTLLNALLKEHSDQHKKQEFDFIVNGELLRVLLVDHLQEYGLSVEDIVTIEYIQRTPPPQPEDALLHDDWISGIQVNGNWILTGCYDNTVNVWSIHGKHQASVSGHTEPVKAVHWLIPEDPSAGFATVSHDLTGVLWHWEPGSKEIHPCIALRGHERPIECLGINTERQRIVTGGWDTHLKVWSSSLEHDTEEPAHKRFKGMSSRVPLFTLLGHKEAITSVQWIDTNEVCTVSMDHTIRLWDMELCGLKNEIMGQKAFLGASWSPLSKSLITCSADTRIRLYDPRSVEGTICKTTFVSHTLWVTAVAWAQHDEHLFMSGGYDESVKLWDTRSPKAPLYELSGHEGKVLCVDWSNPKHLVSGGTDNSVHIFKNKKTT